MLAMKLKFSTRKLVDEPLLMRGIHPALRADVTWEAKRSLVQQSGLLQACR
jgi:hypothetical protein